jgi:hypothetical protein
MRLHGTLAAGNQQGIHWASQRTIMTMRQQRQTRLSRDHALSCRTQHLDLVDQCKLSQCSQAIDSGKDLYRANNIKFFNGGDANTTTRRTCLSARCCRPGSEAFFTTASLSTPRQNAHGREAECSRPYLLCLSVTSNPAVHRQHETSATSAAQCCYLWIYAVPPRSAAIRTDVTNMLTRFVALHVYCRSKSRCMDYRRNSCLLQK